MTQWTAAHQASLSSTISRNLLKLMSVESMMPSSHLILCHLLLLLSIFLSIRVFSNDLAVQIRCLKYWSFSSVGSVQSLSRVRFSATPQTLALQASLSITVSGSLLKLMSIESVIPSSHIILCHPRLLSSIFPSIRVFSSESVLHMRCPKYWSFSFCIGPSNEYSRLIAFTIE